MLSILMRSKGHVASAVCRAGLWTTWQQWRCWVAFVHFWANTLWLIKLFLPPYFAGEKYLCGFCFVCHSVGPTCFYKECSSHWQHLCWSEVFCCENRPSPLEKKSWLTLNSFYLGVTEKSTTMKSLLNIAFDRVFVPQRNYCLFTLLIESQQFYEYLLLYWF